MSVGSLSTAPQRVWWENTWFKCSFSVPTLSWSPLWCNGFAWEQYWWRKSSEQDDGGNKSSPVNGDMWYNREEEAAHLTLPFQHMLDSQKSHLCAAEKRNTDASYICLSVTYLSISVKISAAEKKGFYLAAASVNATDSQTTSTRSNFVFIIWL